VARPLDSGPYRYVWVDALTQKVREAGRVVNVSVVIATAVNSEGRREILGLDIGLVAVPATLGFSHLLDASEGRHTVAHSGVVTTQEFLPAVLVTAIVPFAHELGVLEHGTLPRIGRNEPSREPRGLHKEPAVEVGVIGDDRPPLDGLLNHVSNVTIEGHALEHRHRDPVNRSDLAWDVLLLCGLDETVEENAPVRVDHPDLDHLVVIGEASRFRVENDISVGLIQHRPRPVDGLSLVDVVGVAGHGRASESRRVEIPHQSLPCPRDNLGLPRRKPLQNKGFAPL